MPGRFTRIVLAMSALFFGLFQVAFCGELQQKLVDESMVELEEVFHGVPPRITKSR